MVFLAAIPLEAGKSAIPFTARQIAIIHTGEYRIAAKSRPLSLEGFQL